MAIDLLPDLLSSSVFMFSFILFVFSYSSRVVDYVDQFAGQLLGAR